MEKQRHMKILFVVALVLAVCALTLGYAAFSTTLSISSNATVNPSDSDFSVKIYGFNTYKDWYDCMINNELNLDTINSEFVIPHTPAVGNNGVIDNTNHRVSGIKASFTEPYFAEYHMAVRNEGKYTAYLPVSVLADFNNGATPVSCQGEAGATPALVEQACSTITVQTYFNHISTDGDYYVLAAGDYAVFSIKISLIPDAGKYADGPFTAALPEIELPFSTAKN